MYFSLCYLLVIQIPGGELPVGRTGSHAGFLDLSPLKGTASEGDLVFQRVGRCWVGKNNTCVLLKSILSCKNIECHVSSISVVPCTVILELEIFIKIHAHEAMSVMAFFFFKPSVLTSRFWLIWTRMQTPKHRDTSVSNIFLFKTFYSFGCVRS